MTKFRVFNVMKELYCTMLRFLMHNSRNTAAFCGKTLHSTDRCLQSMNDPWPFVDHHLILKEYACALHSADC